MNSVAKLSLLYQKQSIAINQHCTVCQTFSTQQLQGTKTFKLPCHVTENLNQICNKICQKRIVNTILERVHLGVIFLLK